MEMRVLYACTVCRQIVEWNCYNLNHMYGKPIVCEGCQKEKAGR
jgi:hypothetical protein